MYREKLEKERILQRTEKHRKHVVVDNVIADVNSKNNEKRYLRKEDAEFENFKNREKQKLKEYVNIENRRKDNLNRDENRWKKEDRAIQNEVDRTKKLQQMPFKSEKNKSKSNYDIINHGYTNYDESMKIERKKQESLQSRRQFLSGRLTGGINPITGEKKNY